MDNGFALGLDALKAWCDRNDIRYLYSEELEQIAIPTPLGQGFLIRVVPRPSRKMLTLAMPLPAKVPPALRQEIARATALANSTLFMGAWVQNHAKGEIYFRVSVPTEGVMYDDDAVRYLLELIIGTVRGQAPAFRRILQEGAPAETVLQRPDAKPPAGQA